MPDPSNIVDQILRDLPETQAIYLFGSGAKDEQLPGSDLDLAVLLPPLEARRVGNLGGSPLHLALESMLCRDVDLINLREASTVFQKEVIGSDRRLFCADSHAADEFEMLVLSLYQKLNAERADIIRDGRNSGHFLKP
ncbi:MAG: type VII toxin-antitoxin system MntA family adenylyltransferase antitoxin [Wenzhouxiangella sp.]